MYTVGKVLQSDADIRQLLVSLGERLIPVQVPLVNGSYMPKVDDLILVERTGRNVVYKNTLLRGVPIQTGEYVINADRVSIMENNQPMFAIYGAGYSV